MPEGHKTHFLARQHSERLAGQTLKVTSPQGRFRPGARKISGRTLERVEAVGKQMFYHFDDGQILHIHLGRYGKFREHSCPPPKPVGKVRVRLVGETHAVDLNGPTTCRVIDQDRRDEVVSRLGPDPLARGKKADAWERIRKSKKPIGAILLDQTVIAGVGNIFRAEVLFEIEMNPATLGSELARSEFDRLWKSLSKMMKVSLKHGILITVSRSEAGKPIAKLTGNDRFRIYGKVECPSCGASIETTQMASRKLYLCPVCQD